MKMVLRKLGLLLMIHKYCELKQTRVKEPTEVGDHCIATGHTHSVPIDNLKVLGREQDWIKDAIHNGEPLA